MLSYGDLLLLPVKSWLTNIVSMHLISAPISVKVHRTRGLLGDFKTCTYHLLRDLIDWDETRPFETNTVSEGRRILNMALLIPMKV